MPALNPFQISHGIICFPAWTLTATTPWSSPAVTFPELMPVWFCVGQVTAPGSNFPLCKTSVTLMPSESVCSLNLSLFVCHLDLPHLGEKMYLFDHGSCKSLPRGSESVVASCPGPLNSP